jgi:glutathione S-transferase
MILIGMFDSPFVRRVAVSMHLLGIPFEHRNWSVRRDFDRIREFNPLGRVPVLVPPDGMPLMESAAILDYLDERVGPARALLPVSGAERREALHLVAAATGAADKGVQQVYEMAFRPEDKRHEPWMARCRTQMIEGLAALDHAAEQRAGGWFIGDRLTQADITAACVFGFLRDALAAVFTPTPFAAFGELPALEALATLAARCEDMPAFSAVKANWSMPRAAVSQRSSKE